MDVRAPLPPPRLQRRERDGMAWWSDPILAERGVLIGFTERTGGVSSPPYDSLDLAGHVGDDPESVAWNRSKLMSSLKLDPATRLYVPQQVHGVDILEIPVTGANARTDSGVTDEAPIAADAPSEPLIADGLITGEAGRMLLLCFADCVPIVLAAPSGALAVLHAGWRGVIGGIAGKGVTRLATMADCDPVDINVYIGPHIRAESYPVDTTLAERFSDTFGGEVIVDVTGAPHLDLEAAVDVDLNRAGVDARRIARLGIDTAETADRFFSYRAAGGTTGRHGAFAVRRESIPAASHSHAL